MENSKQEIDYDFHPDSIDHLTNIEDDSLIDNSVVKTEINTDENSGKDPLGVKNHVCNHCEKSYSSFPNLKRHIKYVHEGVKDHVCNQCEKSFSDAANLKRHVKTVHEGVKDHVCNQCQKSFASLQYLKIHVKAVHEGVRNTCNHCGQTYSYTNRHTSHKCLGV